MRFSIDFFGIANHFSDVQILTAAVSTECQYTLKLAKVFFFDRMWTTLFTQKFFPFDFGACSEKVFKLLIALSKIDFKTRIKGTAIDLKRFNIYFVYVGASRGNGKAV